MNCPRFVEIGGRLIHVDRIYEVTRGEDVCWVRYDTTERESSLADAPLEVYDILKGIPDEKR